LEENVATLRPNSSSMVDIPYAAKKHLSDCSCFPFHQQKNENFKSAVSNQFEMDESKQYSNLYFHNDDDCSLLKN